MSHQTETVIGKGMDLTRDEYELLVNLLKHPEIKKMAEEAKKKDEKNS